MFGPFPAASTGAEHRPLPTLSAPAHQRGTRRAQRGSSEAREQKGINHLAVIGGWLSTALPRGLSAPGPSSCPALLRSQSAAPPALGAGCSALTLPAPAPFQQPPANSDGTRCRRGGNGDCSAAFGASLHGGALRACYFSASSAQDPALLRLESPRWGLKAEPSWGKKKNKNKK